MSDALAPDRVRAYFRVSRMNPPFVVEPTTKMTDNERYWLRKMIAKLADNPNDDGRNLMVTVKGKKGSHIASRASGVWKDLDGVMDVTTADTTGI